MSDLKTLVLVVMLAGCETVAVDRDNQTADLTTAHVLFESTVQPILYVCSACHYESSGITLLDYDTITRTPMLNGGIGTNEFDPELAQLLNKGAHHGAPPLRANEAEAILEWLQAEEAARF